MVYNNKRNNKKTGNLGEEMAAAFLKNAGYIILEQNYRTRIGEIDIIARFGDLLAFIEVKTRQGIQFGRPAAAVDYRKQQKIINVARYYMQYKNTAGLHCRFDVIEVLGGGGSWTVNHIKGAFEVS